MNDNKHTADKYRPTTDDSAVTDVEAHGFRGNVLPEDENTEGHGIRGAAALPEDENTEGHGLSARGLLEDEDTEGHGITSGRVLPDDEDTEGHGITSGR